MSGTGGRVQSVFCVSAHTCMTQCLDMTGAFDLPESKLFALAKLFFFGHLFDVFLIWPGVVLNRSCSIFKDLLH